jgi:SAM-dependent methyltransferase
MKSGATKKTKSKDKIHNGEYTRFACDLCGSKEAIELPYVYRYTNGQAIHVCKKCGFIYVRMRRPYDKIAEVWSKELFGKTYTSRTPLMLARHNYISEFIDQKIGLKNKNICDIGAGEGQFLNIVKRDYNASVFGIEPSPSNCAIMKRLGIRCFAGTVEEYIRSNSHKNYRADIVTMMWTLENATSCRNLLMAARQILKKKGYLVIATGSRILVPFAKPLNLYLNANPADAHSSRFSFNSLASFLATTGFKVMHVNPYLNDSIALCVIGEKVKLTKRARIKRDDYREIRDFFKRWHKETMFYL